MPTKRQITNLRNKFFGRNHNKPLVGYILHNGVCYVGKTIAHSGVRTYITTKRKSGDVKDGYTTTLWNRSERLLILSAKEDFMQQLDVALEYLDNLEEND